ncbi:hypothetical protein SAMN05192554_10614 [Haloarchaeobius iranensis]|uniref:Uncharacterized protein n=1 Tax=Haloarchaeobius iranensis TaxID=996166 RepID=A0A1G9VC23_9EURY|nr:hypothetical protein SAMN05192554_10614 [Haloarchaeobius iranensis]
MARGLAALGTLPSRAPPGWLDDAGVEVTIYLNPGVDTPNPHLQT